MEGRSSSRPSPPRSPPSAAPGQALPPVAAAAAPEVEAVVVRGQKVVVHRPKDNVEVTMTVYNVGGALFFASHQIITLAGYSRKEYMQDTPAGFRYVGVSGGKVKSITSYDNFIRWMSRVFTLSQIHGVLREMFGATAALPPLPLDAVVMAERVLQNQQEALRQAHHVPAAPAPAVAAPQEEMDDAALIKWMARTITDTDVLRTLYEYQQSEAYEAQHATRKRVRVAAE